MRIDLTNPWENNIKMEFTKILVKLCKTINTKLLNHVEIIVKLLPSQFGENWFVSHLVVHLLFQILNNKKMQILMLYLVMRYLSHPYFDKWNNKMLCRLKALYSQIFKTNEHYADWPPEINSLILEIWLESSWGC